MGRKFLVGQIVYNDTGLVGSYVGAGADGGHIVQAIFESYEGGEVEYGDPCLWHKCFAEPQKHLRDAESKAIHDSIEKARDHLCDLQNQIHAANEEKRKILVESEKLNKAINSRADLSDFRLWLSGEVTHVVVLDSTKYKILELDSFMQDKDFDQKIRLVGLYVDTRANRFRVSRSCYSDGSGGLVSIRLARSLDHAKQIVSEELQEKVKQFSSDWQNTALVISAHNLGASVASDLLEKAKKKQEKEDKEKFERLKATRDDYAAKIKKLEAEIEQTNLQSTR